jgi:hypothetical protein
VNRESLKPSMTKSELIDLLEASTDIPDDAKIYVWGKSGGLELMLDFVYNEAANAIEIY